MKVHINLSNRGTLGYWVPRTCYELRQALRQAGIERINDKPLSRIHKAQLLAVWHERMNRPRPKVDLAGLRQRLARLAADNRTAMVMTVEEIGGLLDIAEMAVRLERLLQEADRERPDQAAK